MTTRATVLKQKLLFILFTGLISTAAHSATLLVLGDSLSAGYGIDEEKGWVHLLRQQLAGRHRLINSSVSGETTAGGLRRLPALLAAHQPDYVLIELGGNDGLRGYAIPHMKSNLQQLVVLSRASQAVPLLMAMQIPPNYGQRYAQAFAAAFPQVADAARVTLLPFVFDTVMAQPLLLQRDGIHPTAEAQPLIAERMLEALADILDPPPLP